MLTGKEIRKKYLDFFESKGHKIYDSASLIPDDPTMLLTIAGMVPFKPFFMGKQEPVYKTASSCQKCIRTNDLENVGKTARHHTFFEMLGNFSFGDYFKEDAIIWAWEFITEVVKLPKDKLWVSVYKDDEESIKIWHEKAGVSLEKIVKLGKKDNFWSAGPTGSCGPCSEIHIDLGEEMGCDSPTCGVGCDCDRYLEIWNLVFTEFNRLEDGSLLPLPKKNIDTGMGLERMTAVAQGVKTNFDTDLVKPLIKKIEKLSGRRYLKNHNDTFSMRVIADHARAITMLISDGVLPSNEGRGYVLRRILRRAAIHGKLLGLGGELFVYRLVEVMVEIMGDTYKDLKEKKEHIEKVIRAEEEKFLKTINQGIDLVETEIEKMKSKNLDFMAGEVVFKLYDTYGFPFELTEELCIKSDIKLSREEFLANMEKQKERARNSREVIKEKIEDSFIEEFYSKNGKTLFDYENLELEAVVYHVETISPDRCEIIFNKTPFYAESGGQAADYGIISGGSFKGEVIDVQKKKDIFIHEVKIVSGSVKKGDNLSLRVDKIRRDEIRRNHTATHILQSALQKVVGKHVNQAGSMVTDERLRFDFSHYEALSAEQIEKIEEIVNRVVFDNIEVSSKLMSIDKAKEKGAMALFGDKYGDIVRVVEVPKCSIELCGGTHVEQTGEIGLFKIIHETGIAAGTRRIEATTGYTSFKMVSDAQKKFDRVKSLLKADMDSIEEKVQKLISSNKEMSKEIEVLKSKLASKAADDLFSDVEEINGVKLLVADFKDYEMNSLKSIMDKAKDKLGSCVVILGTNNGGKAVFLVGVSKDLVGKGIKAGDVVREVAKVAGGNGGGRPDFAQAGGKDGDKVKEALLKGKKIVEGKL